MNYRLIIVFIFILGLGLRTLSLEEIPYGFHADEARAAWNAWSILKTGKDDQGNRLPWYYDTFGDQRPTGIFYAEIPFLLVLGKTVMSSRLPAAMAGSLSVLGIYWLGWLIVKNRKVALFSALILAVSPWHIMTSRSGSEVVLAGGFIIFGLAYWYAGLTDNRKRLLIVSLLLAIVSYFFYHTARILVPIFWLATWWWVDRKNKLGIILSVLLILVTALFAMQGQSRGRFNQVSIFSSDDIEMNIGRMALEEGAGYQNVRRIFHNKIDYYLYVLTNNYLDYFSGRFLVGNWAFPTRYTVTNFGLMTYVDLILLILGAGLLVKKHNLRLIGLLLLLSNVVAAVTTGETPNLHRAMFMVFFISIVEALGVMFLIEKFSNRKILLSLLVAFFGWHYMTFWHNYVIHTGRSMVAYHRDGGSIELARKIVSVNNQYQKIILTNYPSDLRPWTGYAGKWEPGVFNAMIKKDLPWKIDNIEFSLQKCPSGLVKNPVENSLFVDGNKCELPKPINGYKFVLDFEIKQGDGSIVYTGWRLVKT